MTREQWLSQRRHCLGASDVAAALGISPWKSQFQLWAEKTGNAEPDDLSNDLAVRIGVALESVTLAEYSIRSGREVEPWPQEKMVRHPTIAWLACTPDATQFGEFYTGIVEAKTAGDRSTDDWDEGPPLHYQVQLQTQLEVSGMDWGTIAVLFPGRRELRWWDFDRNDRFIAAMLPELGAFWRLVETRTPPPVDGSDSTRRVLRRLYPQDDGEVVELPPEAIDWANALEQAKIDIKAADGRKSLAENRLTAAIGDATIGLLPNGERYSWKAQTRRGHWVEESTFRVLRRMK